MDVCLDPACVGFDTSLEDYLEAARDGGLGLAEMPITWAQQHAAEHGRAATRELLRLGPAVAQFTCCLGVPGNVCVPDQLLRDRLAVLPAHAELASYLGLRRASVFCDMAQHEGVPVSADDLAGRIGRIADVLANRDIALSVGLIGRDLLDRAGQIWRQVGRPSAGILVDSVSLAKAGLGPSWAESLPDGAIGWLRLADVPAGKAPADLTYADRLLPGSGAYPLTALAEACQRRGYRGPASVEVGDPRLDSLPRAERARLAGAAARSVVPAG